MRLRVVAAVLVVLAACGNAPHPKFDEAAVSTIPTTTTTTTTPAVATTIVATTTLTTRKPATTSALAKAKAVLSPNGVPLTVTGHSGDAIEVLTPCEKTVKLTKASVLATPTVILDPGHGGGEPGAVGPNGLAEKTVNLAVATNAADALGRAGVTTLLTHPFDYRMSLNARTRLVTALHPKVFVSIHHNSDPDGAHDGPGSETYYQVASSTSAQSKRLAGLIYEEVVAALRQYNVAWVGDTDAGAKYRQGSTGDDYYAVLRQTKGVVASLAELAFINNPPEAELLSRADVQHVEGDAVARAIVRYLTTDAPGSGFTTPYARTTPAGGGGSANCTDPPL